MGYEDDFLKQAEKYMSLIKAGGTKTLVTGCAEGYHAFKVLYHKYDLRGDLEVLHISEYLARLMKEGKLKPDRELDIKITYHDPCYLGRLGEPYIPWAVRRCRGTQGYLVLPDIPPGTNRCLRSTRQVLGVYRAFVWKTWPGPRKCWCCGAGGGVQESNPEFALWTARKEKRKRLLPVRNPWLSLPRLSEFSLKRLPNRQDIRIYDLVELVGEAVKKDSFGLEKDSRSF
jgi:hypothetical protein